MPHKQPDLGSLAAPPGDPKCATAIDPNCGIIESSGMLGPNLAGQPISSTSLPKALWSGFDLVSPDLQAREMKRGPRSFIRRVGHQAAQSARSNPRAACRAGRLLRVGSAQDRER